MGRWCVPCALKGQKISAQGKGAQRLAPWVYVYPQHNPSPCKGKRINSGEVIIYIVVVIFFSCCGRCSSLYWWRCFGGWCCWVCCWVCFSGWEGVRRDGLPAQTVFVFSVPLAAEAWAARCTHGGVYLKFAVAYYQTTLLTRALHYTPRE